MECVAKGTHLQNIALLLTGSTFVSPVSQYLYFQPWCSFFGKTQVDDKRKSLLVLKLSLQLSDTEMNCDLQHDKLPDFQWKIKVIKGKYYH